MTQFKLSNCILSLLSFLIFSSILKAQEPTVGGIEFFHGTYKEALDLAKKENKLIFMDAFTTWCGPCKNMAKNVFPNSSVGDFYNANFVNVKMDMEKGEGPEISSKYAVASYPTLLYIDGDGKIVHRSSGARPADAFIDLGKEALKKYDRSGEYQKAYDAGARDATTIYNLVKSLNQAGKPSLKIVNEYLTTQKDLTSKENIDIIFEGATEADSKVFDLLISNKDLIIKEKGKDKFNSKIYQACSKTVQKAMEFRDEALLKEAQSKMKYCPEKEELFKYNSSMEFYGKTSDAKKFISSAKSYSNNIAKSDASKLHELSVSCIRYFRDNKDVMKFAEGIAKKSMENGGLSAQYLNYIKILMLNNKNKQALEIAKKGLDEAKSKNEPTDTFEQIIKQLS